MSTHRARKRFGQHFLTDQGVIDNLVAAIAPAATDHFVEIGPGQGALTQPLLDYGVTLTAIELDRDLAPRLAQRWADKAGFSIQQGDALDFDFGTLDAPPAGLRLVGNLPYNISTPLLFHVLAHCGLFIDMHFMLQKEVVDRLTAAPGSKTYGRLTVMTQLWCQAEALFVVGPEAFSPPPRVDSAIIRLLPRAAPLVPPEQVDGFARLVKMAFAHRRKTLRNNLRDLIEADAMAAAGIEPSRRAETLSLDEFIALASVVDD